ncbi:MAG: LON peptidase substrate-binding domain-containing protein [Acidimicrobiales bacterium]
MTATPMFPLGTVVLPGQPLPLQVFEPRYQTLVRHCLEGPPEFGVTLIERGSEVGGDDVRSDVGTMARIVEATELPDGRWLLMTLGTDRLRITNWLPDDPHPWAEVERWPDPQASDAVTDELSTTTSHVRRLLALATELGQEAAPSTFELPDDPTMASYLLAALIPVGAFDRQRLLAAPTVSERLAAVRDFAAELTTALRQSFENQ